MPSVRIFCTVGLLAIVFFLHFWGFSPKGFHFSDFHFYEKELPAFWGLSVVDHKTGRVNWEFLYHNEGLMALMYYLVKEVPLATEAKVVLVNSLNMALRFLDAALFLLVLRNLVGSSRLFPFALVYLVYPFNSANRYWEACTANHLAALFFLVSLLLYLRVDYDPGRFRRNLILWIVPSLVFLWLSIITVEFAILLSPLYVLLAIYYSNGRALVLRGPWLAPPYPKAACVFLLTGVAPVLLFSGHGLTVLSYASRYQELASTANEASLLVAGAAIAGNAVLVYLSVLFANTLGLILYPLGSLIQYPIPSTWMPSPLALAGITLAVGLGIAGLRVGSQVETQGELPPDLRFLSFFGLLWAVLAYLPFSLSFGYPRNVGPVADRINLLGSMGVALCLGSLLCWTQDRLRARRPSWMPAFYALWSAMLVVLLLNLQLQKAVYIEAERKERAVVSTILDARARVPDGEKEPIFLLDREAKLVTPRVQLRHALSEPSVWGKVVGVSHVALERYFLAPPVPTSFHLEGIYWFWSKAFEFYADLEGRPRPLVYRLEDPFNLTEEAETYRIGYQPREVWEDPSDTSGFRVYPKSRYELVVVKIAESSFRFGGSLEYAFLPYREGGR
ncbi:MAG: hypothetical protein EPO64_09980 [Nitrospirae bacterium]|nr:MAG: hypothetical protein EPO64_09980 [Nitrospirota bacterium]